MEKRKNQPFDSAQGSRSESAPGKEVEIKLRVPDLAALRRRLKAVGARKLGRVQEVNTLFDTSRRRLARRGQLLRLRLEKPLSAGKRRNVLTHKGPALRRVAPGSGRALQLGPARRYKVREEAEVRVDDPQRMRAILEAIGLREAFQYEKRRASYQLPAVPGLVVDLDETPIGVFVELEGHRRAIDRAARLLGYGPADYITKSYRALYLDDCRRRGVSPGDMRFAPPKK